MFHMILLIYRLIGLVFIMKSAFVLCEVGTDFYILVSWILRLWYVYHCGYTSLHKIEI